MFILYAFESLIKRTCKDTVKIAIGTAYN